MPTHVIEGEVLEATVPIPRTDSVATVVGIRPPHGRPVPLAAAMRQVMARIPRRGGEDVRVRWAASDRPLQNGLNPNLESLSGKLSLRYQHLIGPTPAEVRTLEVAEIGGRDLIAELRRFVAACGGPETDCWLHLEIETHGDEGGHRQTPIMLSGVVVGMAADHIGPVIDNGEQAFIFDRGLEAYYDIALDPVGRSALGLGPEADGGDLSLTQPAGRWSLSRDSQHLGAGYIDLRALYEGTYS